MVIKNPFFDTDAAMERIHRLYAPLSDRCKADMKAIAHLIVAEKGETLIREGQQADKTFFIASGSARVYYLKEGKEVTDWFAFEDEFITPIDSFFLNIPSPHFLETIEPSVLIAISRSDMERLCDRHPDFDRLCRIVVTRTMLMLQQRIISLQFETAQQKYENLLRIRPEIAQRVPLGHIASFLGITLETLSRIRHPRREI